MKNTAHKLDTLSRRSFMTGAAKSFFGVTIGGSVAGMFAESAWAEDQILHAPKSGGKAKSVIYLYMSGGLTHLDTFDPKPKAGTSVMGSTNTIHCKADMQLGHCMKNIAKVSDKIALVRSMNTTQGAHAQGKYFMRTAYTERPSITHPSAGGWANKRMENRNENMPGFVTINTGNGHPGAGFFEPKYNPLPIGKAEEGLKNSKKKHWITDKAFQDQLDLRHQLDAEFDSKYNFGYKNVRAYNEMYDAAVKLMHSEDLAAFDLSKEDKAMHLLYGGHTFAKGCLLARRLVERNINFVEVEFGGFDWHNDNFLQMEEKIPVLDQAVSALISDLEQRGLLDTTLVVLATEFGRTPKINQNQGRDHYPKAFSCMMAGGGIKGGYVHGKTDEKGSQVVEGKVDAGDFNATIAHALGIKHDEVLYSPSKRPFKMSGKDGKPIYQMFA